MTKQTKMVPTHILLPKDLLKKLEPVLKAKGLTIDEVARLYFRSLVTTSATNKALEPNDIMSIGKFKDEFVGVIIKADPSYINWLLEHSNSFKLGPKALQLLEEQAETS